MPHADVLIIGAGAGGGALARALAPTGKRILLLDRGGFLPREAENWDPLLVYRAERYKTDEMWTDALEAFRFRASQYYHVGGNTKTYGAAMLRLRPRDFEAVPTADGVSPAWPITYADLAPFYDRAEADYLVHGTRGSDPFEPPAGGPYPHEALKHSARIAEVGRDLQAQGIQAFDLPMGVRLNAQDEPGPFVLRELFRAQGRETFDGYPDPTLLKADAETCGVRPALEHDNVTLETGVRVERLVERGGEIVAVEGVQGGEPVRFSADLVAVACGAVNTAALLLRSGVANGSGRVGRHFMKHVTSKLYAVDEHRPNPTYFQKTLAVNDYYWGDPGVPEDERMPWGHVHLMGKHLPAMIGGDFPELSAEEAAWVSEHSVDWWVQGEDLPLAGNRIEIDAQGLPVVTWKPTNAQAHADFLDAFEAKLQAAGFTRFLRKPMPLRVMNHQCGTARMSAAPQDGVVDPFCRAHELANLYVADASVFPSSAATNPTLTIVANAYRVADHLVREVL